MSNWIDEELNKKNEEIKRQKDIENKKIAFHDNYFIKWPSYRNILESTRENIKRLKELEISVYESTTKNVDSFEIKFKYRKKISKEWEWERIFIFTFKEIKNLPFVNIKCTEINEGNIYHEGYYTDSDYYVSSFYTDEKNIITDREEIDIGSEISDTFVFDFLGWLCFKNEKFTGYYFSRKKVPLTKSTSQFNEISIKELLDWAFVGAIISFFIGGLIGFGRAILFTRDRKSVV